MIYAGLDLHKSFCQTKICTKEGELVKERRIKTETEDIEEFFEVKNAEREIEKAGKEYKVRK
ncbi:hypothetical protein DRN97_07755 [Methanosarcinales archaeon]|nr:MAG: hypothetical protein DRN97_07755 [Methanosarcinales archaeon]